MNKMAAIYRRELMHYFQSVTAYVAIGIFLVISGYFFFSQFRFYNLMSFQASRNPYFTQSLNLTDGLLRPFFGNISIILLLVLPLLTMRLLAEEKKQGTFELLLTYPIRDIDAVGGKFLASVTTFAVMLGGTFICPLLIHLYANPEPGPIFTGYLGLFLIGCTFISIGTFFSSLTNNQLVAGVSSFGVALLFLIIGWIVPFVGPQSAEVLRQFSLLQHFEGFSKGLIDTQDMTYYIFMTLFFLFLTLRSLESTRWRS
jgi:ABC-2 type transport system permease protein